MLWSDSGDGFIIVRRSIPSCDCWLYYAWRRAEGIWAPLMLAHDRFRRPADENRLLRNKCVAVSLTDSGRSEPAVNLHHQKLT
jgi:hypothetical protein